MVVTMKADKAVTFSSCAAALQGREPTLDPVGRDGAGVPVEPSPVTSS